MAQALSSSRLWDNLNMFSELLGSRLKEELERRGIRVRDVEVKIGEGSEDSVRYTVTMYLELGVAMRLYLDGIYELCNEAVAEKVAEGEVPEEKAEEYVEKCVDEEKERYDEEYGEPPFRLMFSNRLLRARVSTLIETDGYVREYVDAVVVSYSQEPKKWLFEKAEPEDVKRMVEAEVSQILPEVLRLYQAVKILYER